MTGGQYQTENLQYLKAFMELICSEPQSLSTGNHPPLSPKGIDIASGILVTEVITSYFHPRFVERT